MLLRKLEAATRSQSTSRDFDMARCSERDICISEDWPPIDEVDIERGQAGAAFEPEIDELLR